MPGTCASRASTSFNTRRAKGLLIRIRLENGFNPGARFRRGSNVTGIERDGTHWKVTTSRGEIRAAEEAYAEAIHSADLEEEEVEYVVGTGYGRYKVTFGNTQVTEISCPMDMVASDSAFSTCVPRCTPPSIITSMRLPTASTTSAS